MKNLTNIKRFAALIICAVLLLMLNRILALSSFGEFIQHNGQTICHSILCVVFFIDVLLFVYGVALDILNYYSKKIYNKTLHVLSIGIEQKIKDSSTSLYDECLCLLMSYNSSPASSILIQKLCAQFYEGNSTQKERIAYLFIVNKANKSIAAFCNTPKGSAFLKKCEQCSNEVLLRRTFADAKIDFSSVEFEKLINEFLHFSLFSNIINTNEMIDYIRKVLSWIKREIKNKNSIKDVNFQLFIMVLAKLEKKLSYHNVNDGIINTYISRIKQSCRFRCMYFAAICRLLRNTTNETCNERMNDVGLIVAHIWKFGLLYRAALLLAVRFKLGDYNSEYLKKHNDAMAILVMVTPLGNIIKPDDSIVDKILTIISAIGGNI